MAASAGSTEPTRELDWGVHSVASLGLALRKSGGDTDAPGIETWRRGRWAMRCRDIDALCEASPGDRLSTLATSESHYPIKRIELLSNGEVVADEMFGEGSKNGQLEADIAANSNGWIAARLTSDARDSFYQPVFAHTSPVYVETGQDGPEKRAAAAWFDGAIDESLQWVRTKGRFYNDSQRKEIEDLFREGQQVYRAIG